MTGDLELLRLELETCFVLAGPGRFQRVNDPEQSAGPRLALFGSDAGYVFAVRQDVDAATFARVTAIMAAAPPWTTAFELPACAPALMDALGADTASPGVAFHLPSANAALPSIVRDGTPEGEALLARLDRDGFPPALVEADFKSRDDFWPPWVVALEDGEIAATCFAARLGERSAEAGVYAFEAFRGRGLAGAVTSAWSAHPALTGRTLFYSTQWANTASQRVAAKLGLRRIGQTLQVD
jgi:hypothetical protein